MTAAILAPRGGLIDLHRWGRKILSWRALFPAIALAPKAAIVATPYTDIPALMVGYGAWFLMNSTGEASCGDAIPLAPFLPTIEYPLEPATSSVENPKS